MIIFKGKELEKEYTYKHISVFISYLSIYLCACVHTQLCLTLCNPMDCSPPGFTDYGIFQARILGPVAISSSRGSSQDRDWTHVSCTGRMIHYHSATWEALYIDISLSHFVIHLKLTWYYKSAIHQLKKMCWVKKKNNSSHGHLLNWPTRLSFKKHLRCETKRPFLGPPHTPALSPGMSEASSTAAGGLESRVMEIVLSKSLPACDGPPHI